MIGIVEYFVFLLFLTSFFLNQTRKPKETLSLVATSNARSRSTGIRRARGVRKSALCS